jgi:micrococcal nuclease
LLSRRQILLAGVALAATALVSPRPAAAEWTGPCLSGVMATGTATPICHFWRGKIKFVDDGDTLDVRLPTSTGKRKTARVRITGIQAMEQSTYDSRPRKRRGECHAVAATARLERLIKKSRGVVRLGAQDPSSAARWRLRRSVAVRIRGKWKDVGRMLVAEGHALWFPDGVEWAWNATYSLLSQRAAVAAANLWNPTFCGAGPSDASPLRVTVNADARGNDFDNLDDEWVRVDNLDPAAPVVLAGWWVRDSALRRFTFPAGAVLPPLGSVTVRVGSGVATADTYYWGLDTPEFENPSRDARAIGDGAYLFDPQGDLRAAMIYPCYVNCAPS